MNRKSKNSFQVDFANAAGMLASRLSLSPTVGQIYGLLYMSPDPVSLNEMVEKLGISKGSASINVRVLESWGAVRKVWVDNTRKDYYEANPDTLNIIMSRLKEGLNRRLDEAGKHIGNIDENRNMEEEAMSPEEKEFYRSRIDNIRDMYEQVKSFMEFFSEGES